MARIKQHLTHLIELTSDFATSPCAWRTQYRPFARRHASSQPGDDARWIARAGADVARTFGLR
jgi:hypothetical protein